MPIKSQINKIFKRDFARSASVLVGGSAAAQVLTLLALPILTRIYTPEDFNVLAVYVAILTMVHVVSCLRLELAIPLAQDDAEASNLLALALMSAFSFSCLAGIALIAFGQSFNDMVGAPELLEYHWLLPFGILLAGSYSALQFWNSRQRRFSTVAQTRMTQAASGLTAQIGLGWAGVGAAGLMLGHALMAGAGVVSLARAIWRLESGLMTAISWRGMRQVFSRYKSFPLYSTWEALANTSASQLPVLFIASFAIGPEAGFILLATRVLSRPITMIGGAVRQVHLSSASEEMRQGRLTDFTVEVLNGLARVGVAPLTLLAFIAPAVFAAVFGQEWQRAGELVAWMTPWFILKLLTLPASNIMHVRMRQLQNMILNVSALALIIGAIVVAYFIDPRYMAETYALAHAVFQLISLVVFLAVADAKKHHVKTLLKTVLGSATLAVLVGYFVKWVLGI